MRVLPNFRFSVSSCLPRRILLASSHPHRRFIRVASPLHRRFIRASSGPHRRCILIASGLHPCPTRADPYHYRTCHKK